MSFWKNFICFLLGHKFKVTKRNISKHVNLVHLHSMAGLDAKCLRCGYEWNDANCPFGIFK